MFSLRVKAVSRAIVCLCVLVNIRQSHRQTLKLKTSSINDRVDLYYDWFSHFPLCWLSRSPLCFPQEQNSSLAPALITVWWFCCCFFIQLSRKVFEFTSKSQSTSQKTREEYWDEDTSALSVTEQAQNSIRKSLWALPAPGNSAALNNLLSGINSSPAFIFFFPQLLFLVCFRACAVQLAGGCACSWGLAAGGWHRGQPCQQVWTRHLGCVCAEQSGTGGELAKLSKKKGKKTPGLCRSLVDRWELCERQSWAGIQACVSQCQFSANGALWVEWEMKQSGCFCLC